MKAWRKFLRLNSADRLLLAEALVALVVASCCIACLPFRAVGVLASRRRRPRANTPENKAACRKKIRWAVEAVARRLPWRAVCFQQGLAAQVMLQRRGMAPVLYYGVAPDADKKVVAHVWIREEGADVIGCEQAERYVPIITFPNLNSATPGQ